MAPFSRGWPRFPVRPILAAGKQDHPRGGKSVPASYYRIQERGRRTPYQFFTNPLIERVFRDFSRVKMYLTRASPDF